MYDIRNKTISGNSRKYDFKLAVLCIFKLCVIQKHNVKLLLSIQTKRNTPISLLMDHTYNVAFMANDKEILNDKLLRSYYDRLRDFYCNMAMLPTTNNPLNRIKTFLLSPEYNINEKELNRLILGIGFFLKWIEQESPKFLSMAIKEYFLKLIRIHDSIPVIYECETKNGDNIRFSNKNKIPLELNDCFTIIGRYNDWKGHTPNNVFLEDMLLIKNYGSIQKPIMLDGYLKYD